MSWGFKYEYQGSLYEGGWEMNHGMICLYYGQQCAFTTCGDSLAENERNRDNAMHQLLVLEGLAEPIPGQVNVPIKLGWN
ncbi:hypothetical protein RAN3_3313 [plant metagenome]|uniref:Uncharacterized protein n=1 Tax=plant metagenome TaxID=1297885 RepID=A0A484UH20_9ZZZZ